MDKDNPKKAYGAMKAPMACVPNTALIELYGVMGGGAHKYGIYNYRNSTIDALTYIGAIRRHFMLWEDGEDEDHESGYSHLAHIMACCAILFDSQYTNNILDNRSKSGETKEILVEVASKHNKFIQTVETKI